MGKTTGGPLLCVDDLMHDLLEEPAVCAQQQSSPSQSSGLEVIASTSESLDDVFQMTYKDLESALASSGHSWTSLTQQLYSALISANQVVAAANSNLQFLAEKVASLRLVLERGDAVMSDLQAAVSRLDIDEA
eukprot:c22240_g1_i1 orf=90-488(+)